MIEATSEKEESIKENTEVKSLQDDSLNENVDKAMRLAMEIDDSSLTEKSDKKLYHKINFYLLPLVCLLYACQYMDKVTSSYAAIVSTIISDRFISAVLLTC